MLDRPEITGVWWEGSKQWLSFMSSFNNGEKRNG